MHSGTFCTPIMDAFVMQTFSKQDKTTIIKFFVLLHKSPKEIHDLMIQALGSEFLSYDTVRRWVRAVLDGTENVEDEARSGRPVLATAAAQVDQVATLLQEDRRLTTRQVAASVGISHDSAHKIITVDLNKRKLAAKWIPHLLTEEQMASRVTICAAHLRRHRQEGDEFLRRIVACDETWAHSWEPELKRQSAAWCGEGSPRPLKAIRSRAQLKVMHITFFDHAGLLFDQAVPVGQIVNGDYYLSVLKKVRRAINDKRPELENAGPILLQDNAGPHRKREVLQTLDTWSWELLPHPPYSPDLSPCDFFLFPRVKNQIRGQHFSSEQEVNEAYRQSLTTVTKLGLHDGIFDLVSRWRKCIEHEGSYFEN